MEIVKVARSQYWAKYTAQAEQRKDSELNRIVKYLQRAELPGDSREATWVAIRSTF